MTRAKKLFLNTTTSLIYQFVVVVCGFILPRFFLIYYGTEVNGLVASITQFLGFIMLAECGVGAVVQSALYKPLAEKNDLEISKIIISAERFFRKIAMILVGYTVILMIVYPFITLKSFNYFYTLSLIFVISISSFAQYFFAMPYRLLLFADQMAFVPLIINTVTILLNTVFCILLMKIGADVQIVKLLTSSLFLIQPVVLSYIVKKRYNINKKIMFQGEPIKQKWNGLAQHIASVVLTNTDSVVLTIFSTLENVSIYTVYNLVVCGVRTIVSAITEGMQSMLGNMYARKEKENLENAFSKIEWLLHMITVFFFTCTAILIIPFVKVYTANVTDANYIVPFFAVLIVAANAAYCLRLPYNMMVLAAGHYRQTQMSAIMEAVINLGLSIILVMKFGLIGVAIGTLIAMMFRTIYLAWYLSNNILYRRLSCFVKHIVVDVICVTTCVFATKIFVIDAVDYFSWVILAVKIGMICLVIVGSINFIFYKDKMKSELNRIRK